MREGTIQPKRDTSRSLTHESARYDCKAAACVLVVQLRRSDGARCVSVCVVHLAITTTDLKPSGYPPGRPGWSTWGNIWRGRRKKWKIFLAPQGRRGQVSRLNRDLGPNCGALRARRYAPGATRHDLGPFEGFGPKNFSRPYREKQGGVQPGSAEGASGGAGRARAAIKYVQYM